jgi:hypothetical protein
MRLEANAGDKVMVHSWSVYRNMAICFDPIRNKIEIVGASNLHFEKDSNAKKLNIAQEELYTPQLIMMGMD